MIDMIEMILSFKESCNLIKTGKKIVVSIDCFLELYHIFFNCYLAVPQPTVGHSQGDSLTNPMLITVFVQVPPGH